ncbi:hypothetical protein M408DRAFT_219819 [Serendipita vermifera MAFF 305830]|uniref:Uncharacterized protein n=1 Tax=Serendipita vermifera MAFF 305830 TaxID=933852 RepID=A0A0C3B6M9_SERVB|nr:hypothetical protein M408DRAFT_219819 [Serendipita vermifera MAFF 305830]
MFRLGRAEVMALPVDRDRPMMEDRFEGEVEGIAPLIPSFPVGVKERTGSPTLVASFVALTSSSVLVVAMGEPTTIASTTCAFRFPVVDLSSLMQMSRPDEVSIKSRRRCLAGSIPRLTRVVTGVI